MSDKTVKLLGKDTRADENGVYTQGCFPFIAVIKEANQHERVEDRRYVGYLNLMGGGHVVPPSVGVVSRPHLIAAGCEDIPELAKYLTAWAVELLREMLSLSNLKIEPQTKVSETKRCGVPPQDIAEEDLCMAEELTK